MRNPLLNVPLNTKKTFVKVNIPNGCELYMPVDSDDEDTISGTRDLLQAWVKTVYPPTSPTSPTSPTPSTPQPKIVA